MISDIIQVGNKVELCLMSQIQQEKKSGAYARIYKSSVTNIFEDENLELSMPIESGKVVLLPVGAQFEFVFYSQSGLYRGAGLVKERYKTGNQYLIRVGLKSQLHRYQRREYYRLPCRIKMAYYDLTQTQVFHILPENYRKFVDSPQIGMTRKEGEIIDISGGGAKFITSRINKQDSYIMVEVQLRSAVDAKDYLIPARILSSQEAPKNKEKFENRAEFIISDRKIREEIIRYIFDEERKNRTKKEV